MTLNLPVDRIQLMTGIIDYNAGNIQSVEHALQYLGAPYILSKNPKDLENVDRIIFPGDGDAVYAMQELKKTGFDVFLKDFAASGKRIVGICIGAQIVFDWSEEGNVDCLSLIPGTIRRFSTVWGERHPDSVEHESRDMLRNSLKIPHMGWNDVTFSNGGTKLCDGVADHSDFYFIHSYVMQPDNPTVIKGYADYGTMVPSIVEKDNITVFQFHPEKSGPAGLRIFRNYVAADLSQNGGSSC